eukprot:Nk52_evm9s859 gene=Nk52_evmTU9s859
MVSYSPAALAATTGALIMPVVLWQWFKRCQKGLETFKGKIVWITGASGGIGKEIALMLCKHGAKVILSARNKQKLEECKKECEAIQRGCAQILILDVGECRKEDYSNAKMEEAVKLFGTIDVLVNNAGISSRGTVIETGMGVYESLFNVDFFGTVGLTKAVLPILIAKNCGRIIVVSSLQGKLGLGGRSAYSSAKHALHGFFDALRIELHRTNVTITLACPGYVKTALSINAVTGSGQAHGQMDSSTASGMAADICAKEVLLAGAKGEHEVLIASLTHKLAIGFLKPFLPDILFRFLCKRALKENNTV